MRNAIITFCALMCALTFVGGCATDTNGNPCSPALSGCGLGTADTTDGGSVDGSVSDAGQTDTSDTTGSDTGVNFDCTLCTSGEECILNDGNPRCEMVTGDGYIVVTSNVKGAKVFLDGQDTGEVTPATIKASAGSHTVLIKADGRLQWNKGDDEWDLPLSVKVKADDKCDAKITLYYDSHAYWKEVETTSTHKWKMKIDGPSDECPNGGPYILSIAGRLCLDSPTKISICKDKNPNCDVHGTGEILDDGMKIVLNEYIVASGKTFKTTYKNKGL